MRKIQRLILHHTASASGTVEQIRREHQARGWTDIGYHWILGNGHGLPDGHLAAGRPEEKVGAAVALHNAGNLYLALVGQLEPSAAGYTGPPTRKQLSALGHWLWKKGRQFQVKPENVLGHREWAVPGHSTACPGGLPLYQIREWYKTAVTHADEGDVQNLADFLNSS